MSRTIATVRRPDPHEFKPDKIDPTTCSRCPLPEANGVHSEAEISRHRAEQGVAAARIHEAQERQRLWTGER